MYASKALQSALPIGEGREEFRGMGLGICGSLGCLILAFAFDVVGDLVDLVEDVAVAVYKVRDLARCVHDGRVVSAAEGASYFGE